MKKCYLTLLVIIAAVFFVFANDCLSQPKRGGTLTVAMYLDPMGMDGHKVTGGSAGFMFQLMTNNLVEPGPDYEPKPGLATSWEVSKDCKVWTFRLRKGVKFHNGRECKAKDVKWNIERIMNPKTGAPLRTSLRVESVTVVDPYTVKLSLEKPNSNFVATLYGQFVLFHVYAPECMNEDGTITHPIGTGPFQFVEYKPNDHTKVKRFDGYWEEGKPYLDEVILKVVKDPLVSFTALRTGDVDMVLMLGKDQAHNYLKNPPKGIVFSRATIRGNCYIAFNNGRLPFSKMKVRQAVAYAIDKNEMLAGGYYSLGEAVNQSFGRTSEWYFDIPDRPKDLPKAKALLKEAGYPNGVTVTIPTTHEEWEPIALVLQQQLKPLGINVKVDVMEKSALIKKLRTGDFDFTVLPKEVIVDPSQVYPDFLRTKGKTNWVLGAYSNPQMDELLDQGSAIPDVDKRKKIYRNVVEIMHEEVPMIWWGRPEVYSAWRSHVKGYKSHLFKVLRYSGGGLHYTWLEK